ncbi:MBL fold metallo-hydrolase [uncultured Amnibacterium sp.]|uniref:MBL fold metallo-hydrolase n=1 Tax=uncultured Amnibacterium sp. TaxID=1631851 RepID=UPI0035CBC07B
MILRRLRPLTGTLLVATSRRWRTTSTVVLGPRREALLVDPAWTPDDLEGLAADLRRLRLRLAGGLSTHGHYDHVLWHRTLPDVPRWGSAPTAARAGQGWPAMLAELGPGYPLTLYAERPPVRALTGDGVPWAGQEVRAIVTGAHDAGHTAFWLPRERVLLAGDLLSDVEVPLIASGDADGGAYRAGLAALEPFVRRARFVVPGHGSVTADGSARLAADLRWLDALDRGSPPTLDARTADPDNAAEWDRQRQRRG